MRVSEMGIKHLESATRLLDRDYVNRWALDLSKKILWVSVGQEETELPAIKFRGFKKHSAAGPSASNWLNQAKLQNFFFTSKFDSW